MAWFHKEVGASLDGSGRRLVVGGDRFGWFLIEKVGATSGYSYM